MIDLGHRPSFYPMTVSDITSVSFSDLTETQKNIVKQGHFIAYNEALTDTMAVFRHSHYSMDLFMSENTIIGHYVSNKAGLVVSFCSIDSMTAITMTLELSKRFTSVPIRVPAIASFFQDLHFEPYPTVSNCINN